MSDLDPASLSSLYRWIDTIPLDRPKKNIARDFSDGVLMSQVIAYFFPKIVELHNYSSSNSIDQKNYNWKTLNRTNDDTTRTTRRRRRHTQHQHARSTFAHIEEPASSPHPIPSSNPPPSSVTSAAPPKKTKSAASQQRQQSNSPTRNANNKQTNQSQQQQQHPQPQPQQFSLPNGKINGDKDATIHDLRETVDILQLKVQKLEQLLRLKNSKIESLQKKLADVTGQPI